MALGSFISCASDWDYYQHIGGFLFSLLHIYLFFFLGRTTLLRKLAVGFHASALEREGTEGPLEALGQRYGGCTLHTRARLQARTLLGCVTSPISCMDMREGEGSRAANSVLPGTGIPMVCLAGDGEGPSTSHIPFFHWVGESAL